MSNKTPAPAVAGRLDRQVRPLATRLREHIAMMAPHQRERTGGALLLECEHEIQRLQDMLFARGAMDDAPCFCCGYNGHRYYQPDTHTCAKRHHALRNRA